ncbi:sulfite exporter TauE/SafE family protein [Roseovarius salinarum]|uniref:sulfite exporter TauE/SafE family protein n=1 Tax=Roseovarius salinarum TaxID=1981892 RepID=UPI000C341113|nr:sulfite exporter TauE/SafE family protein [Roseovarius salinarum]
MAGFDAWIFAVAVPAVVFAGISKGGFGSGAAFAAAAILALVIPPGMALGILLPLLMLIDVATLRPYWRRWSWPDARVLVLGALPGVGLGAWLYRVAEPDVFRLLIGAITLGFVGWQALLRLGAIRPPARAMPAWGGGLAGVTVGFTSFVSHAGGPAAAVYLLSRGLDKTRFQATTVLLFWLVNIAKFVPYAALGIFSRQTLLLDLALAPFALLGAWLGVRAHRAVPERVFFAITYTLLTVTGAKLIWDGLV